MDERLSRIKTIISEIEEREAELNGLMTGGAVKTRKPQACSICQSTEHSARTCPQKPA